MNSKKCRKCSEVKPESEYYTDYRSGRLYASCKKCIYSTQVRYREKSYFKTTHHNKSSECKRKGLEYDLDEKYLESIWTGVCPALGIKLIPRIERHADYTPNLDRINPESSYVRGNVRFISRKANLIKSNASWEDILKVAEWLRNEVKVGK